MIAAWLRYARCRRSQKRTSTRKLNDQKRITILHLVNNTRPGRVMTAPHSVGMQLVSLPWAGDHCCFSRSFSPSSYSLGAAGQLRLPCQMDNQLQAHVIALHSLKGLGFRHLESTSLQPTGKAHGVSPAIAAALGKVPLRYDEQNDLHGSKTHARGKCRTHDPEKQAIPTEVHVRATTAGTESNCGPG